MQNYFQQYLLSLICKAYDFELINKLLSLRKELILKILENLDYLEILNFRMVSKQCNEIIIWIFPLMLSKLSIQIDQNKQKLDSLQPIILNQQTLDQPLLKGLKEEFNRLVNDLKESYLLQFTEQIFFSRFEYLHILFNPQSYQDELTYFEYSQLFWHPQWLEKLENFEIASISEQQLRKLQNIYGISEETYEEGSQDFQLLLAIQCIIQMRETQYYISKNQEYQLNYVIQKTSKYLQILKKIIAHQKLQS